MTPTPITGFRFPLHLLERIDSARGGESRTSWLIRAAEAQLDAAQRWDRFDPDSPLTEEEIAAGVLPDCRGMYRMLRSSSSTAKAGVVPR